MPSAKPSRIVKVTYRVYWDSGTSKYCVLTIPKYEDTTNEDIRDYLIGMFQREIGVEHLQRIKIISIDSEKVNVIVQ